MDLLPSVQCTPISEGRQLTCIRAAIDRVLWTAGATEINKQMLAEAILEELIGGTPGST